MQRLPHIPPQQMILVPYQTPCKYKWRERKCGLHRCILIYTGLTNITGYVVNIGNKKVSPIMPAFRPRGYTTLIG